MLFRSTSRRSKMSVRACRRHQSAGPARAKNESVTTGAILLRPAKKVQHVCVCAGEDELAGGRENGPVYSAAAIIAAAYIYYIRGVTVSRRNNCVRPGLPPHRRGFFGACNPPYRLT